MKKEPEFCIKSYHSQQEASARGKLYENFEKCPIPENERLDNLGLFINRQSLTRMLFMHELYQKIIPVHGVIVEFGVRWGQNLALFSSFRGMYEPYNHTRKIVGFDTFSGFPSISDNDGSDEAAKAGGYSVTDDYDFYLQSILEYHENESPLSHIRKFELIKGDATKTLGKYLSDHPETIIALAYFDFDIYEPTKKCLEMIKPYLTKGSVVGFDELNCPGFPGETVAVREVFGLDRYAIQRSPIHSYPSFVVID